MRIPKTKKVASSRDYDHLNSKIRGEGSTYSEIQKKREEIKESIENKIPEDQAENIKKFKKVLFRALKDGLDNSITSNQYLFELMKDVIKKKQLYDGLYKIDVIKKTKEGIICRIHSGNYQTDIEIDSAKIMEKKPKEDKLEEIFTMQKKFRNEKGELISKERRGKPEDFLEEIQYKDSVIIDIQKGEIRKVDPDNIIDEIKAYIKKDDNEKIKAKKIHIAMKFLNDSRDRISSEYITEFFKGVREKQKKRQGKNKEEFTKEQFAEVLKRFVNKEKAYVHKGSDIDKSALQFILKKIGIKDDKVFHEIAHSEVDTINEGLFFDVGGTVNGIKSVDKVVRMKKGGIPIKETKTIISEHSDGSDEALLNNRTCSTTHMIFRIATQLGMINKEDLPQMERFMYFVNAVDSMDYQISSIDYPNNYQTLFGLYRKMDIADIYDYFKDPAHSGFEKLSPEYMEKMKIKNDNGTTSTLKEFSEGHHQRIEKNIENFKKLQQEKKEFTFKSQKYIVDLKGEIEDGAQTAGYYGYGYFTIGQERGNIYMYNPKKLPFMIEGFSTDGHFLIINNPAKENIEPILERFFCSDEIKKEIIEKIEERYRKKHVHKIIEERKENLLKPIEKKDLKVGKSYTGVINNITNKIIYVYLDNEGKIRGMIRFENKEDMKNFNRGDLIHLRIKDIRTDEENPFVIGTYIPTK